MSEKGVEKNISCPNDFKNLRACLLCHLIKTES